MDVHFNDHRVVNAPAAALFEVITDYASYPKFNHAWINVRVVRKDDDGAEFLAERRTRFGRKVRAFDHYDRRRNAVVERTSDGPPTARSTWTVHAIDATHSTLTVDVTQSVGHIRGHLLKPALRKRFYGVDVTTFVEEAERRAKQGDR